MIRPLPYVLVVEDSETLREMLADEIRRLGYGVTTAWTWIQFEACWETRDVCGERFVAVVTDNNFPEDHNRLDKPQAERVVNLIRGQVPVYVFSGDDCRELKGDTVKVFRKGSSNGFGRLLRALSELKESASTAGGAS